MKHIPTIKTALKQWLLYSTLVILSACSDDQAKQGNQTSVVAEAAEVSIHQETADITTEQDELIILALGDSLTEGLGVKQSGNYPAILEQRLHQAGFQNTKVVNSGLSGETSSGLKARLDWVLQLKPDITILNIGANDAMRGLPLSLTENNINEIITAIQATGSQVILAGMQIYDNLGKEYVSGFKDMYPELAERHNLNMIPFFLEHVAGDAQLNQADMIHPNTAGYAMIVDKNVLPAVMNELKQISQHKPQPNLE